MTAAVVVLPMPAPDWILRMSLLALGLVLIFVGLAVGACLDWLLSASARQQLRAFIAKCKKFVWGTAVALCLAGALVGMAHPDMVAYDCSGGAWWVWECWW